jgi:hypothetical protein
MLIAIVPFLLLFSQEMLSWKALKPKRQCRNYKRERERQRRNKGNRESRFTKWPILCSQFLPVAHKPYGHEGAEGLAFHAGGCSAHICLTVGNLLIGFFFFFN